LIARSVPPNLRQVARYGAKDTLRNAVPVVRCDREKALLDAWWGTRIGRTQRAAQR
jgi:hypothetical protein